MIASIKLLIATQELIRQADASLDYRPELRLAIAAAHQAVFAVSICVSATRMYASWNPSARLEFLAAPTLFNGVQPS